jgi:murein L,D-transpeptidase YcbB/YkuD
MTSAKQAREELAAAARQKELPADPLAAMNLKSLGIRVGIPALIAWGIALAIPGWIPKVIVGVLTLVIAGLALWAVRFAKRSRAVAQIVREADTAEARKEAIAKLDTDFKKDDSAAIFAKAQLQLQEDPRAALRTLETIKLDKVMSAVMADETRSQRAMIHLMLGETEEARALCDHIDMTRHKEPKSRAMMAAIVAEAWARTGQAKRAVELLETFDPADEAYADLRPQLYRARAFAYAWTNNMKSMKQALRSLSGLNPQFLSGFITKKKHPMGVAPKGVHPILEKEAFEMVMRSGAAPRRMEFRRG